ncbi:MAG: carbohydrate ABC transporter permease [Brevefilum sp.]|nr:carbohydrate ABC transporter permease [Brevefilum sp.]
MLKKTYEQISGHAIAIIITVIVFIPIYLVTINALKDKVQASSMGVELPSELHWENFATVVEKGKLGQAFANSLQYATFSSIIGVLLSASAAYVLSRNRTKFNRFLYFMIIMGIALPINFVTLTKIMQVTQLINSQIGIIILYSATQIPFSVFVIYAFVESVPRELDEAAIIEGCNPLQLFTYIILPLLTPALVTTAILNFLNVWSEFLIPIYFLNSSDKWPMTLAIYNFFGQFQADWSLVSADIVLTILPVIIIYLFGQRYIISGITSGAIKG